MRKILLLLISIFMLNLLGCGKRSKVPEMTVLIKMMPAQRKFFVENIIPNFEKRHKCKIKVADWIDMWDIESTLKLEKGSRNPSVSLVKTPFEMTRVLVGKGYMKAIKEVVDSLQMEQDIAEYDQLAIGLGYVKGDLYYIPRKLETRIMFYLKSKVEEAVKNWKKYEKEIKKTLRLENGYGLPKSYTLESDPNQWDNYDLFVVGYYWARTPYFGVKMPRIAFRGARYEGTALRMMDLAIKLGASEKDIIELSSDPVFRMFEWNSRYVKHQIINPMMWEIPTRGSNIWDGFRDGKVFLTWAQQIDCFFMHGWENSIDMPGYLKDPDDMGLAVMPMGVSFGLKNGKYLFEGDRRNTTGGWWWGIPKTAPQGKLAYALARFISNHENQAEECSRFGMMPVRKDILNNLNGVFDWGWVGDIFKKSAEQIMINQLTTIPLSPYYSDIGRNYIDAWYAICVPGGELKGPITDPSKLRKAIGGRFLDKQRKILGGNYPQ